MNVVCTHENLRKGLNLTSRVSSGSMTLPILNNILLKTENGMLRMSATNLEIGINTWIRCKINEEGAVTVPAKTFNDVISNLPSDNISLSLENNYLDIQSGNFKTKIKGLNADEFPLIPQIEDQSPIEINASELKEAISQVVFAAASSETQPEISGILFSFEEGLLTLVATDRYRLAEKQIKFDGSAQNSPGKSYIIPNRAVSELNKSLSVYEGRTVRLFTSQNQLMFKTDETEIITRLIDGQYPDYKHIIPQEFVTEIHAETKDLVSAMRTAGIFTTTGNNISLGFKEPNSLIVNSSSGDIGESVVNISSTVTGPEGSIIFNHRYILDCLSSINTKNVIFKIINGNSPAVIESKELPGYLYLVMPIKI